MIHEKSQWSSLFEISKVSDFSICPGFHHQTKQFVHVSVQEQDDGTFSVIFSPGLFNLLGIVNGTEFVIEACQEGVNRDSGSTSSFLSARSEQVDYPWPDNSLPQKLGLYIENKKVILEMNSPKVFRDVRIKYDEVTSERTLVANHTFRAIVLLSSYGEPWEETPVYLAFNRLYYLVNARDSERRKYAMLNTFHPRCNLALIPQDENMFHIRLDQNTAIRGRNSLEIKELYKELLKAKEEAQKEKKSEACIKLRLEPKRQQIVLMMREMEEEELIDKRRESFISGDEQVRISFEVHLIGLSLIDKTPEEIFYLFMRQIRGEAKISDEVRYLKVRASQIQMDNQIPNCNFKVAIASLKRRSNPLNKHKNYAKQQPALVLELKQRVMDQEAKEEKKNRQSENKKPLLGRSVVGGGALQSMRHFGENFNRFKLRQYDYIYIESLKVIVADLEVTLEYKMIDPLATFGVQVASAIADLNQEEETQAGHAGYLANLKHNEDLGVVVLKQGLERY